MPDRVFFTADNHFNHRNIVAKRPQFSTVEEMNEAMVERWNSVVGNGDRVYHLGDVALGRPEDAVRLLSRLKGQIFLIRGNHDKVAQDVRFRGRFVWVKDYFRLKVGEQKIVLMHYAMRVWDCRHYGSWQLHGHSHGTLPESPTDRQFDVGVDAWNFTPVSYEQVEAKMATKTWGRLDHHAEPAEDPDV